jgi:hypothetical protein
LSDHFEVMHSSMRSTLVQAKSLTVFMIGIWTKNCKTTNLFALHCYNML